MRHGCVVVVIICFVSNYYNKQKTDRDLLAGRRGRAAKGLRNLLNLNLCQQQFHFSLNKIQKIFRL